MQGSSRIDELRQKFHENPRRYFAPLANEYRKAGDPEQAIAICRAHLAQQPGHMSGHVVYGQALFDARRPDEARTVFEKALSLDPDNAIVVRHLGDIAREKGDTKEAKHWYGKALDLDPSDTEVAAYVAELTEPLVGDVSQDDDAPDDLTLLDAEEAPAPEAGIVEAIKDPDALGVPKLEAEAEPAAEAVPEAEAEVDEPVIVADAQQPRERDLENEALDVVEQVPEDATSTATPAEPQGDGEDPESPESDIEVPLEVESEPVASEAAPAPVEEIPETSRAGAAETSEQDVVSDIEVPLPEGAGDLSAAPESEEVPWRKTPRPEDSPFVTRTMAELYARQGYRAAALDVYRQLAIRHPEDAEIRDRIAELTGERDKAIAAGSVLPRAESALPDNAEEPQSASSEEPAPEPEPAPEEDLSDEPAFAPSAEDLNVEIAAPVPDPDGLHFTEMEISDTPADHTVELDSESPFGELSWELEPVSRDAEIAPSPQGHDNTVVPVELEKREEVRAEPETVPEQAAREPAIEPSVTVPPATLADAQTGIDEAGAAATSLNEADFPPASDPVEAEAASNPEVVEDEAAAAMIEPEPVPPAEIADEEDDRAVVAYSPEPPRGEDIPHFTPRGPTVREFFATLGAYRPASSTGDRTITARAAIPSATPTQQAPEDLPLATDAFSNLFADAPPVSEEDSRAAFALSGAISGTAHNPNPSSLRTSPPLPAPAVPDPSEETRESEEDIRRFREWLDGLADS